MEGFPSKSVGSIVFCSPGGAIRQPIISHADTGYSSIKASRWLSRRRTDPAISVAIEKIESRVTVSGKIYVEKSQPVVIVQRGLGCY